MTSEGLGEMFEGDSADTCSEKFPLLLMGGPAKGLVCADPGASTPERKCSFFLNFYPSYHLSKVFLINEVGADSFLADVEKFEENNCL